MKKINKLACILLLAFSNLYAFDGERKGFILGGGFGAGYLSNTISFNSSSESDGRAAILTNLKIGYAPSNTLEIYYITKASWWGESNKTFILGLSAKAATVYIDNKTETGLFISGGIGFGWFISSDFKRLFEKFGPDVDSSTGFGLFGGVGYEI